MPGAKQKARAANSQPLERRQNACKPIWPPVERSKRPLSVRHVIPGHIVTIPNFWDDYLCKKYVNYLRTLPLNTTSSQPKRGEAVRMNDRFQCEDEVFAETLWSKTGLKELILSTKLFSDEEEHPEETANEMTDMWGGDLLGLSSNIRIYRYGKGQFFDKHYDDSNSIHHPGDRKALARTTWTLLLYLTSEAEGCKGGATVFYPEQDLALGSRNKKQAKDSEPIVVAPETGMLLLHRHGTRCMLHEGREVLEGEKWIIRSDLCVRR